MRIIGAILALALVASAVLAAGEHNTGPNGIPGWGQNNTSFSAASGASSITNAVYDWDTLSWQLGTATPDQAFTVEADVEMWMSMGFNATDIYFHIGNDLGDNPKMSQSVNGWLNSNNGQYLFVTKPAGVNVTESAMTTLTFKNDIGARDGQTANPIPVGWYITDNSGQEKAMEFSTGGNGGQEVGMMSLLDNGSRGLHNFSIRCEISPDRYQPDGHYEMDPILAASPAL